jgi:hypothetical protein
MCNFRFRPYRRRRGAARCKAGNQEELADVIVNIHKWNGEALPWVLIDYEFVLK